ncbi:MAG TPA: class I SAM-dependent methyltransferase [Longimicrobiaceae bacterium]|jgi:SAM-dependent methyltransferase|nr:class I SAM-dependent methyltransferase [Longimicrobiaceae bacterium]
MPYRSRFYPESDFGGFTDVDGTVAFFMRVNALLTPNAVVADVGCGRAQYADDPVAVRRQLRVLRGKCRRVVGIDVDPRAAENPYVDEFHLLTGARWPLDDASVDLCLCDWVVEHVADPDAFFSEAARVLRPGGHLCIRTSNAASYVGLAARLVPGRLHARVLGRVQVGRQEEDVFETSHRANTPRRLRRYLARHGFGRHAVYGYEAEPAYLSFSRIAYWLGVLHQRFMPRPFRVSLFAFARRDGTPEAVSPKSETASAIPSASLGTADSRSATSGACETVRTHEAEVGR